MAVARTNAAQRPSDDEDKTPAADPAADEVKHFILAEHVVQTIDPETGEPGEPVKCKRASWGKEQQILALFKDLVHEIIKSGVLDVRLTVSESATTEEVSEGAAAVRGKMIAMVTDVVLETGPDKLTAAVCILTGMSREDVNDRLESEEMLRLVVPFFWSKRQSIGTILDPYLRKLQAK